MTVTTLAEELVLLAYDDSGALRVGGTELNYGLGGALLLERPSPTWSAPACSAVSKRRLKEISQGSWAAAAVRQAIQEVQAAVTGAAVAVAAAGSGS
jgi:hypothetical protein